MIKPGQGQSWGIVSFLLFFGSSAYAQTYRVLLTNDDGIESPLLAALKVELQALPGVELTVSAPHENQSGSSQSTAGLEVIVERIYQNGNLFGYAVHGTPADAVRFGLIMLSNGNDC